jgi:HD-GYP domain-containing protein (c-di-GMP phosphodiesterase class II)
MAEPAQNDLSHDLERQENERIQEERARKRLINRVGREVVPKMESLERVLRTYDVSNEAPRRILTEVTANLQELIQTDGSSVGLVVLPDHVFINGLRTKLDTGTHDVCGRFGRRLAAVGVVGFTISEGFSPNSLVTLFSLMRDSRDIDDPAMARAYIAQGLGDAGVAEISLMKKEDIAQADAGPSADMRSAALNAYVRGMAALAQAEAGEGMTLGKRRRQRSAMRKIVAMGEDDIGAVVALSGIRDIGVGMENHAMNVSLLSIGMGLRIGIRRRDLIRLGLAALNHDVGEKLLPDGLLTLERELTRGERQQMEEHPLAGLKDIILHQGMAQPILERALVSAEHHEWYNGRGGYPILLRPALHLFSRVVAVCDTFDALTMDRPWRKSFTPPEAIKLVIRGSGTRFDPVIVRLLVSLVGRYPPGSLVELDTGEWAVVLGPGDGDSPTTRPRVLIVRSALGKPIDPPEEVDTNQRHHRRKAYLRTVVRGHDPRENGVNTAAVLCGERNVGSIVETMV